MVYSLPSRRTHTWSFFDSAFTTETPTPAAAQVAIVLVGELRAGVKTGEDDLDSGDASLGVPVDRHPAAVVGDRERSVFVERGGDLVGVAGDGLVGGVVDDFLGQVVGAFGGGVHAGRMRTGSSPVRTSMADES